MRKIPIKTSQRTESVDITAIIRNYLHDIYADTGVLIVFCPHTTAGITINENADPDVRKDLTSFLDRTIPREAAYAHSEGNSDAHIKSTLTNSSQVLIVESGKLMLGQWQGVFFMEFDGPRQREIWLHYTANASSMGK
jgi:secondary thiamine-phosphate synthase enzyme